MTSTVKEIRVKGPGNFGRQASNSSWGLGTLHRLIEKGVKEGMTLPSIVDRNNEM